MSTEPCRSKEDRHSSLGNAIPCKMSATSSIVSSIRRSSPSPRESSSVLHTPESRRGRRRAPSRNPKSNAPTCEEAEPPINESSTMPRIWSTMTPPQRQGDLTWLCHDVAAKSLARADSPPSMAPRSFCDRARGETGTKFERFHRVDLTGRFRYEAA